MYDINMYDKDMEFMAQENCNNLVIDDNKNNNLRTGKFKNGWGEYYLFLNILPDIKLELSPKEL